MTQLTQITLILVAISSNHQAIFADDWRARTVDPHVSAAPSRSTRVESIVVRDHLAVASDAAPCRVAIPSRAYDAKAQHAAKLTSKGIAAPRMGCHPILSTSASAAQSQHVLAQPHAHAAINSLTLPASHPIRQVKFTSSQVSKVGNSVVSPTADPIASQSVFPTIRNTQSIDFDRNEATVGKTNMDELSGLVPEESHQPATSENGNYLSDLNGLLREPSSWIFVRGVGLDLRPDEPELVGSSTSYMNDLQALVADSAQETAIVPRDRRATMLSRYRHPKTQNAQLSPIGATPARETYLIPAAPPGENTGSDAVVNLFQPMNSISVNGVSTAPPSVPQEATKMELELPSNKAFTYREFDVPNYYLTNGYGIQRAPRNTHCFQNNPLYFEDANLERCGISHGCLTTAASAVQFTTTAVLLPYLTKATHPRESVPALPDCPTCSSFGPDAYFPE